MPASERLVEHYFPHRAAGFQSNPFRALTDHEWAASAVVREEISAAFAQSVAHLQLLGAPGAGKTTTLLGLGHAAEDAGLRVHYRYLPAGQDRLGSDPPACDLLLLDEAQRLSRPALACLLDRAASRSVADQRGLPRLVVASHEDLTAHFRVRGLPVTTFSLDMLPHATWRAFLDTRLSAAALPGRAHATLTDDAVLLLADTFGENRRAAVTFLYEVFQRLRAPVPVDVTLLRAALSDDA